MKKALTILSVIILTIVAVVGVSAHEIAYDNCHTQDVCYNQDGDNFCSPKDVTCTFITHIDDGGCKVASTDADSDGDGWSDLCDAYPADSSRWFWNGSIDVEYSGSDDSTDDNGGSKRHSTMLNARRSSRVYKVPALNKSNSTDSIESVILQSDNDKKVSAVSDNADVVGSAVQTVAPTFTHQNVSPTPKDKNFPWYILVLILASMWWAIKSEDAASIFREK